MVDGVGQSRTVSSLSGSHSITHFLCLWGLSAPLDVFSIAQVGRFVKSFFAVLPFFY